MPSPEIGKPLDSNRKNQSKKVRNSRVKCLEKCARIGSLTKGAKWFISRLKNPRLNRKMRQSVRKGKSVRYKT